MFQSKNVPSAVSRKCTTFPTVLAFLELFFKKSLFFQRLLSRDSFLFDVFFFSLIRVKKTHCRYIYLGTIDNKIIIEIVDITYDV